MWLWYHCSVNSTCSISKIVSILQIIIVTAISHWILTLYHVLGTVVSTFHLILLIFTTTLQNCYYYYYYFQIHTVKELMTELGYEPRMFRLQNQFSSPPPCCRPPIHSSCDQGPHLRCGVSICRKGIHLSGQGWILQLMPTALVLNLGYILK